MSNTTGKQQAFFNSKHVFFQFICISLWVALAVASLYSSKEQFMAGCFIPAGLSMALLLSYGRAAVALVFLASFSAALISLLLVVPSVTVFLSDLPYALGYAIVHTLIFYVAAWSMTRLAGGFMRFEQISHVFIVIYGSLFASALSSLATTALFAAESAMDPFPWLDHFVLRWMASLTGVLCFALSFTSLLAYFRCERFFDHCYLDTHHLRRGLKLDRRLVAITIFFAMIIFGLDSLGNLISAKQFILGWMGIITLSLLVWASIHMPYPAISILVALFSGVLLMTEAPFWQLFHVANIQVLLPTLAIAGTLIWVLSSSVSSNKTLHQLANTDELTGLANRRQWFQISHQEFLRIQRNQSDMAIILIDLDHFKRINDTYGHQVGDEALKHAATLMKSQLRGESTLCRYGGEEFALLLPECTPEKAYLVAERIRRTLQNTPFRTAEEKISLTASLGVAHSEASDMRLEDLVKRADDALYQAKALGRNKVCPEPIEETH